MSTFVDLLLALFLGICLGLERSFAKKTAGMRTYGLVSMGACLFVLVSRLIAPGTDLGSPGQLYVLQGLIVGIGFIGGGAIMHNHSHNKDHTSGITTAAGLWMTAGIGATVGFGYAPLAIFATILTLFVFTVLWFLEHAVTGNGEEHNQ